MTTIEKSINDEMVSSDKEEIAEMRKKIVALNLRVYQLQLRENYRQKNYSEICRGVDNIESKAGLSPTQIYTGDESVLKIIYSHFRPPAKKIGFLKGLFKKFLSWL